MYKPQLTVSAGVRLLFIFCVLCCAVRSVAQVKAGIKVNNIARKKGDTIRICKGTVLTYSSNAVNVTEDNINWKFKNGTPGKYTGLQTEVLYEKTGIDTTFQFVSAGNKKDSVFIFIKVSDTEPKAGFTIDPPGIGCGSEKLTFTSTSTTATGKISTYNWSFGDNGSSTANPATHTFASATGNATQTFEVTLLVTNDGGCSSEVTQSVTVKEIPDASLGNADIEVTGPLDFNGVPTFSKCDVLSFYTFSFVNATTTSNTNTGYKIKWNDGSADSSFQTWDDGAIIKHPFLRGNTTITLEVTGKNGCTATKDYNVFLGTTPKVGLSNLGNSAICEGESLKFKVNDVNDNPPGTFYNFVISDGTVSETYNSLPPEYLEHTFDKTSCGSSSLSYQNSFYAQLTAINSCNSAKATVEPIYVSGKAKAEITPYPADVACVNSVVTFYNSSDLGGVIVVANGVSTCKADVSQVWTISPSTGFTISSGDTGKLNGSSTNWLLWKSGTANLDIKFTQAGTYTVKMYVTNKSSCSGGIDSTEQVICIRNVPEATFSLSSRQACDDATITLQNTSQQGNCSGDNYYWYIATSDKDDCSPASTYSFVNGTTSNSASPEVKFSGAGNYYIQLTATAQDAGYGCPSTYKTDTFTLSTKPKVTIDPLSSVCVNNTSKPTATVLNCYSQVPATYKWSFEEGNPATSDLLFPQDIVYNKAGTFGVKLSATNDCGTATDQKDIVVIEQPVANAGANREVCSGAPVLLGSAAQAGLTYQWLPATHLNDATSATPEATLFYNGVNSDTTYAFVVTAKAGAGCEATDTVWVTVKKSPVVTVSPASADICAAASVALTADGATTYTWLPAGGLNTAEGATVTAKPLNTTTFVVTGTLANGCSSSAAAVVNVRADAKAEFSASKTTGCIDFSLEDVISPTPYTEQNESYRWYANGTLIGANNTGAFPGYTLSTPGDLVTIKLVTTSLYGCLADSMQLDFTAAVSAKAAFTAGNTKGCGPLPVTLSNETNLQSNVQFAWDFGNGQTATTAQPPQPVTYLSSPYNNDTVYYIKLTANDGCSVTTAVDTVWVSANPRARFGIDSTFGCSPYSFTISNTSLGKPDTYYWDFGDGKTETTTTEAPFTYGYTTGILDTFRIQLVAENKCRRDTQFVDVIVVPNPIKPQINISGSNASGCAPHTVFFNNNTTGATRYVWHFGDNAPPLITTDNETTVSHTYTSAGTFGIQVDITNGCSDTSVLTTATIYNKPLAAFDLAKSLLCENDTLAVSATQQNADAYRWDWNDGTKSSGTSATHTYKKAGTYLVTLFADRINNIGIVCSDMAQRVVTVSGKPDTKISANNAAVNCAPFGLSASAPAAEETTLTWTVINRDAGTIESTGSNQTFNYTFSNAGAYSVRVNAVNTAGCQNSDSISLAVFVKPTAAFTPFTLSTCATDTTIIFTNTSAYTGADAVTYQWLVDDVQRSATEDFTHRFTAAANEVLPKTFYTALIAKNSIGCSDTAIASLAMQASSKASFTLGNAASCVPFSGTISNTSSDATSYSWLVNGANAGTTAIPIVSFDKPATPYTIRLIAGNEICAPDTALFSFTTLPKPVAGFSLNDSLGCAGSLNVIPANLSTGATSYTWIWGDNTANGNVPSPTHLYTDAGRFTLSLLASDGRCADTAKKAVAIEQKPVTDFAASNTTGCDTVAVQFTNLSTGASTFEWRFGDGTASVESNPFKRYPPSEMPYTVTLVTTGKYGCRDSAIKPNLVTTIAAPAASFTVAPGTVINEPQYKLNFINTTIEQPNYRYLWDMGDNTRYPFIRSIDGYRYKDTGKYTVRLIVNDINTGCVDTASVLMTINGVPGWLYVPNAFCPKCIQQELRTFLPAGRGLKTYDLQIFTTWGQMVYHSNLLDENGSPKEGWNGTDSKGNLIQQDVYIWKITASYLNGTEWKGMKYPYSNSYKREGSITIVK